MSAGVIAAHYAASGGGGSGNGGVTFIARTVATSSSSTNLPPQAGAAVGDMQIAGVVSHASITPGTPSGWTLLSRTTSAHSGLSIFYRVLTAGNVGATTGFTWVDVGRVEMRTYRGCTSFVRSQFGIGLTAPAVAVATGLLIRLVASAQANAGNNGPKTLTADPALLNSTGVCSYIWYDGLVIGDDPSAAGSTAPASTATQNAPVAYPQWVDVEAKP